MPVIIRTLIFSIFVPGSVTILVPLWLLSRRGVSLPISNWSWLGLLPVVIGFAGYCWCARDFAFSGRGTPGPWDPPEQLVVRRLYRFVRNPMYVSVILVLAGESVLFLSRDPLLWSALFWMGTHLFVMLYEERTLRRRFATSYERYLRSVPRWIPRRPVGLDAGSATR
ncbi:MAG: isoprenylcysteine carboxylmethyltransferase family protein [Alphaproteobacteria bacterium]|nr:isoprenylcysteine carboxylmethyltransferase family protein [Alphaproteobacteria bacterium]